MNKDLVMIKIKSKQNDQACKYMYAEGNNIQNEFHIMCRIPRNLYCLHTLSLDVDED